jgi:hypothetical protein
LALPPPQGASVTRSYAAAASCYSAPTSVAAVVMTPPRPARARSKSGFARCPLEDYPDIASIERFVSLAPPSTELWVEHRLAAWDCAKFPDLIQARLDLMASAVTIAGFLACRLASEPDVDHSVMLVQGLRRGTLCVRPAVARLYRAPRTVPAQPWVASVTAPVLAASGVAVQVAPARGGPPSPVHRGRQHAHKSALGHRPPEPRVVGALSASVPAPGPKVAAVGSTPVPCMGGGATGSTGGCSLTFLGCGWFLGLRQGRRGGFHGACRPLCSCFSRSVASFSFSAS